jgi:hypothetical protein
MLLDQIATKQRYEEMLREAEQIRLANRAAKANGVDSLFGRMVKLLSRSSRLSQRSSELDRPLHQQSLADAKGS